MPNQPFVFVSYARADSEPVHQIVEELRRLGVHTWIDAEQLVAGDSWVSSIEEALRRASAYLVFISPESMESKLLFAEFLHAAASGIRILQVLLRPTPISAMPLSLQQNQWLDVTQFPPQTAARLAAVKIANILSSWKPEGPPVPLPDREREELAKALAIQTSGQQSHSRDDKPPNSVFIVHGHDDDFLDGVVTFVRGLDIIPIVMKNVGGAATSLIGKFFEIGGAARFAIVLLSADDMGASCLQYEETGVSDRALKFRSRQNVILELGYFYGFLGWDKVFVLEKAPTRVFPDYERPSDLNGVLFDRFDKSGRWKAEIRARLAKAGFKSVTG